MLEQNNRVDRIQIAVSYNDMSCQFSCLLVYTIELDYRY